jgi:hypothetical protein
LLYCKLDTDSRFSHKHAAATALYQCTRGLLISTTMPHPDSLSAIGTSRTTTPGSSEIQVMACSVPGLPRLAMRLPSKIRYMSVVPSGREGSSGTVFHHALWPALLLHGCTPVVVLHVHKRRLECSSPYGSLLAEWCRKLERIPFTFEHSLHARRNSCILLGSVRLDDKQQPRCHPLVTRKCVLDRINYKFCNDERMLTAWLEHAVPPSTWTCREIGRRSPIIEAARVSHSRVR